MKIISISICGRKDESVKLALEQMEKRAKLQQGPLLEGQGDEMH
jgi:hypothetical protein